MDRTVRLLLKPTTEQRQALAETLCQFTAVFNAVARYGFEHSERNGVRLHHATYYPLKAEYPKLVSDLHVQARVKATEAVKSALTLKRKGRRVSCPESPACPARYNLHTFRVSWKNESVTLSTSRTVASTAGPLPNCAPSSPTRPRRRAARSSG